MLDPDVIIPIKYLNEFWSGLAIMYAVNLFYIMHTTI